jgi:hypothetical protein
MNNPFRECNTCGKSFWGFGADGTSLSHCPACLPPSASESEIRTSDDGPPRFVSLSALPPDKRVPPRPDGYRPGLFVPRRLESMSGAPATRPVMPAPLVPPPLPPSELTLPDIPRLGFNCPACFAILFIKDPEGYDGRAAPCPHCNVTILPPRVAPQSPFILVANPASQGELPSSHRTSRWKPFKQNDFSTDVQTAPAVTS